MINTLFLVRRLSKSNIQLHDQNRFFFWHKNQFTLFSSITFIVDWLKYFCDDGRYQRILGILCYGCMLSLIDIFWKQLLLLMWNFGQAEYSQINMKWTHGNNLQKYNCRTTNVSFQNNYKGESLNINHSKHWTSQTN